MKILALVLLSALPVVADEASPLERLRDSYKSAIARAVTPLTSTYVNELRKLRDGYIRGNNLKAAAEVEAELTTLGKEIDRPIDAEGHIVVLDANAQIPANDPNGYRIGAMKKGDSVTLTYVSGKWKNNGNIATEDPDVGGSTRGDDIRLVIAKATKTETAGQMITMVRTGTANKPFTYVFASDHDDVVLRIRTGTRESPGKVIYNVKIMR